MLPKHNPYQNGKSVVVLMGKNRGSMGVIHWKKPKAANMVNVAIDDKVILIPKRRIAWMGMKFRLRGVLLLGGGPRSEEGIVRLIRWKENGEYFLDCKVWPTNKPSSARAYYITMDEVEEVL
jgi:hypothetical protein